jgi:hypothetical protein
MPPAGNPTVLLGLGFQLDPGNKLPGYYIGHAYGIILIPNCSPDTLDKLWLFNSPPSEL